MSAAENKQLVEDAFAAWGRGDGDFYSLLSDDVVWTVLGSSPVAGTFPNKEAFLKGTVEPLKQRLAGPVLPHVRALVAEDDKVVVLWQGEATGRNGSPYNNVYFWLLRFEAGQVVEVTALFDTQLVAEFW